MDIAGSVALVTGANRGLGRSLAAELVRRGARVYAGARNQGSIDLPGVTPVTLDITDPSSVSSALEAADDITILVNNAGISTGTSILNGDLDAVRREMETHFFGTLSVTRAAAPVIAANGGGAVLNILSALSWLATPRSSAAMVRLATPGACMRAYIASKQLVRASRSGAAAFSSSA